MIGVFLGVNSIAAAISLTGVDGDELGGDDGVDGRFLSADTALFGNDTVEVAGGLCALGEGQRFGTLAADGVGDIYLELTSLVRDRRVVPFLLSAETRGGLKVTVVACFPTAFSDSTSIQIQQIKPH